MQRPGFTIILSLAAGSSLLAAIVCGIGVVVLIGRGSEMGAADIQSIIVFTATAIQCLVSYAICAALVWLIDRNCEACKSPDQAMPAADNPLTDKFGRPAKPQKWM